MFNIYDLFESVGILIDSKLQELKLDRTIICTIIDYKNGLYTVAYNNETFTANSFNTSLQIGDVVYVGVPEGEYSNAYIISKYGNSKSAEERTQVEPFANFVKELKIPAYYNNNIVTWVEGSENQADAQYQFNNINQFKKLGISCNLNLLQGKTIPNCGLKLYIIQEVDVGGNVFNQIATTLDFNFKAVCGEQSLNTTILAQDLYDITSINNIKALNIQYYHIKDDNIEEDNIQDITLTDINIWFGNLLDDYQTPGLFLYTEKQPQFPIYEPVKVYAKFVYQDLKGNQVITNYTDIKPDNIKLYWNDTSAASDQWIYNINSNQLPEYLSQKTFSAKVEYNSLVSNSREEYKANIQFTTTKSEQELQFFNTSLTCQLTANITDFKTYYGGDGILVDRSKISSPDYQLYFTESPLNLIEDGVLYKAKNDLEVVIALSIPNDNSNIYFVANNSFVQDADNANLFTKVCLDLQNINKDLMQFYIDDFYTPGMSNNIITCVLTIRDKETKDILDSMSYELQLDFSRAGVCKSDYVMIAKMTDINGNRVNGIKAEQGSKIYIKYLLFDATGQQLDIDPKNLSIKWYHADTINEFIINKNNYTGIVEIVTDTIDANNHPILNYIVQTTYDIYKVENNVKTQISCYIPLGVQMSNFETTYYFEGPTMVTYNSAGAEPSFYQTHYKLLSLDRSLITEKMNMVYKDNATQITLYPSLLANETNTKDTVYKLKVPTIFTKGTEDVAVIQAIINDETILWQQPIFLNQSKSFSSAINDWNGQGITTDPNQQYFLTPALGAGRKNDNGTFSGVVLGDAPKIVEDNSVSMTGVYGYDEGQQSYGLREDGSAFFGKSGEGRINFDGDLGLIYSGNFDGKFYNNAISLNIDKIDTSKIGFARRIYTNSSSNNVEYTNMEDEPLSLNGFALENKQNQLKINATFNDTEKVNWSESVFHDLYVFNNSPTLYFDIPTAYINRNSIIVDWTVSIDAILTNNRLYLGYYNSNSISNDKIKYSTFIVKKGGSQGNSSYRYDWLKINNHTYLPAQDPCLLKLYDKSKFNLSYKFTKSNSAINNATHATVQLCLLPLFQEANVKCDNLQVTISDIRVTLLNENEQEVSLSDIANCENLYNLSSGMNGTYINLKDGQFITNGGIFRGNLEAQSLTLLNDLVLGDPANTEGKPWLRITPEGGFEASSVAPNIKHFNLTYIGDDTTSWQDIYNDLAQGQAATIYCSQDASNRQYFVVKQKLQLDNIGERVGLIKFSSGYEEPYIPSMSS